MHAFLTSAVDGGEWTASRPGRYSPGGRVRGIQCIGGGWTPEPV
jgi:hypothetical protein